MNPYVAHKEDRESTTYEETGASDIDTLTQCDFSAEQIVSLLGLRQRYQSGGSDREVSCHERQNGKIRQEKCRPASYYTSRSNLYVRIRDKRTSAAHGWEGMYIEKCSNTSIGIY